MAERFAAALVAWGLVTGALAASALATSALATGASAIGASAIGASAGSAVAAIPLSQAVSKVHVITIEGMLFKPGALSVSRGDRIRWVNKDLFPHTATADGGAFDSKNVAPEESWTWVAERAGTFAYTCAFHPTMKGVVTVR